MRRKLLFQKDIPKILFCSALSKLSFCPLFGHISLPHTDFAIAKAKTTNRNKTFYLCTTCGSHIWMPGNGIILHVDCLIVAEYLSASFLALFSLYCSRLMFSCKQFVKVFQLYINIMYYETRWAIWPQAAFWVYIQCLLHANSRYLRDCNPPELQK